MLNAWVLSLIICSTTPLPDGGYCETRAVDYALSREQCKAALAAEPAQAPAVKSPAAALTVIEPGEGSSSGHIDYFRWSAVEGADGYRMRLNAMTDGRLIWESPVLTTPEAELPNTIALEPESYVWQVTALQGGTTVAQSAPARFSVTP